MHTLGERVWLELTSPDYPLDYCPNLHCKHIIRAPVNHRIVLNVSDLQLENDHDLLTIVNGEFADGTVLEM